MLRRQLLLGAVAALTLAGCKEEAKVEVAEIRPVRTVTVEPVRLDEARALVGEIQPERDIDLGFRVSGKLVERLVDVGDTFVAGQVIARLDNTDYVQRLESAKSDVFAAEAVLAEATGQHQRTDRLYRHGYATKPQIDAAVKGLNSAKAKLDSAKAALKLAESQLDYTEIRADFDGIVTATGAEEGQVVNTGQMILRTAEPRVRDAVFNVAEDGFDADATREGARMTVLMLDRPEIRMTGIVREVSPTADAATRTYQIRVGLEAAPAEMRFGASVAGRIDLPNPEVMVLPAAALFDKAGEPAVWVVDPLQSAVNLTPITVGRFEADGVIVAAGLATGDIVVAAGVHQLRENQKVRVQEGGPQ
jgi:RND family efflux transporter MFP subunit